MTFENTVSKILEEGHVKTMTTPRRACMRRLMTLDEAKEVCETVAFGTLFSLTTPLEMKYYIFSFPRLGNEAKCHSTHNVSGFGGKWLTEVFKWEQSVLKGIQIPSAYHAT